MALTKIKLNTMVTGTLPDANIPDDITIDTAAAAPANALTGNTLASGVTASSLTSVGTLSSLNVSGVASLGNNSKATSSSADTTFKIETTSGSTIFPVLDFVSSHNSVGGKIRQDGSDVISFDNSQNSTFAGDVNVTADGARFFVKSADYELVSIGRAGSSGSALDQGYIRMKNAGTNTIALHSASNSYLTNGLSVGTSSINSNAVVHIRGGDSGQSSSSNNTQLTVEGSGSAGIQILTGTTSVGGLWVGDSNGSETGGKLYYSNNSDGWTFFNQASVQSCDIGLSMVNLYNNDTGSAGSTLKQLSLGKSDNTAWNATNSGTFTGIAVSNSSNTDNSACGIAFTHRTGSSGISYIVSRNEGSDASSLHFGTRSGSNIDSRLDIGKDGDIYVSAASNNKASINVVASGTGQAPNDAKVYVSKNSGNDWSFSGIGGADDYGVKLNGAGNYALFITDHNQSSDVRSRISFNGYVYSTDGSIHDIDSDERKKEDIGLVESQWQMLKDLPLQKFKWKDRRAGDKYSYGWIAQDVQEKYPELVNIVPQTKEDIENEVEDPEYLTVMTGDIHRLAINALQEAMAKIETLEAKVEALENA